MIRIGDTEYAFSDPAVWLVLAGVFLIVLILLLLVVTLRRTGQSAAMMSPLARNIDVLGQRVQSLSDGQHQLSGGLTHVSEAQSASQANMIKLMEQRLAEVSTRINENLQGSATRTARSLG